MMQKIEGESHVEILKTGSDALFILLGAIMVLAMHAGFAFLELGTVRKKNQVNALVKILVDFAVSTIAYFFIGYSIAYGVNFFSGAELLAEKNGYELVKFFFLLTFAAAIPAIISGGIAERAKFNPQLIATFVLVGFVYPFFEGIAWNQHYGIQAWIKGLTGEEFHDFAGSVVVHAVGGWIALPAVILLGARRGRYTKEGQISAHPPSSIPFLALGAWILAVGWFGFNVMSAQTIDKISGLVALNSLMAMVGGTLAAGAANAFNMVIESDIDKLMSRTKHRPIAAGILTKQQASRFASFLMIASLLIFWIFTTPLATLLTSLAILFYVAIYTVALKPNTNQNIVWGGIAGCLPVLIGWAAVTNSLSWTAFWFFMVVFFWTPPHFWAIAIKYHDDYEAAKIPMLPVVASKKRVYVEMWFHTIMMIVTSLLTIYSAGFATWSYYLTLVLAFVFAEQVYKLRKGEAEYEKVAGRIFHFSILYLTLFSTLLVVGQLLL